MAAYAAMDLNLFFNGATAVATVALAGLTVWDRLRPRPPHLNIVVRPQHYGPDNPRLYRLTIGQSLGADGRITQVEAPKGWRVAPNRETGRDPMGGPIYAPGAFADRAPLDIEFFSLGQGHAVGLFWIEASHRSAIQPAVLHVKLTISFTQPLICTSKQTQRVSNAT